MPHNRNRLVGGFEEAVEKGQSTVKNTTKNAISDTAKTTKNQITGGGSGDGQNQTKPDQGTNEAATKAQDANSSQMTDEERVKFLRDLYGSDGAKSESKKESQNEKKQKGTGEVKQALGVTEKDPHEGLNPEEIAKLEAARRQLHGDYYQEFIAKTKKKEEPVKEKIEKEEQQKKMDELQSQDKQDKKATLNPAIVKQGTAEMQPGTVG